MKFSLVRTGYRLFLNRFYSESGRAVLLKISGRAVLLRTHSFLMALPWFTGHRLTQHSPTRFCIITG